MHKVKYCVKTNLPYSSFLIQKKHSHSNCIFLCSFLSWGWWGGGRLFVMSHWKQYCICSKGLSCLYFLEIFDAQNNMAVKLEI
jgi:hypothetical protein